MKNAGKHADDLRALMKRLVKEYKPEDREPQEPLKALVRGAMSFDVSDSRASDAMRAIETEFVDLNELRVATDLEIQELLGVKYPEIERRVEMITRSLNNIFEREHTLSLDRLKTISKRDARQFLRELPDIHPFVEAYVMLYGFEGHSFPIDDEILEFFRDQGIVEDGDAAGRGAAVRRAPPSRPRSATTCSRASGRGESTGRRGRSDFKLQNANLKFQI